MIHSCLVCVCTHRIPSVRWWSQTHTPLKSSKYVLFLPCSSNSSFFHLFQNSSVFTCCFCFSVFVPAFRSLFFLILVYLPVLHRDPSSSSCSSLLFPFSPVSIVPLFLALPIRHSPTFLFRFSSFSLSFQMWFLLLFAMQRDSTWHLNCF